ncbi:hypothetical protein O9H85_13305 [Paenibacillus filicis]|uniref:Uncharacterized protein n=1 Tax=Paenibacillus gyeongsangnamensis TaxID=3388067 RepID=A0ABT4Q932_9BACL|nr:hypothetical protein [Paenibacillus filicis]MCZ8513387.1 hypothetical protein [Paenibacillus filicis]
MKMNIKSNLNKRIRILSVGTSAFYTDQEHVFKKELNGLYLQRKFLREEKKKDIKRKKPIENLFEQLNQQLKDTQSLIDKIKQEKLYPLFNEGGKETIRRQQGSRLVRR